MNNDLVEKIARIVEKNAISENDIIALVVHIRKILATMIEKDRNNYLILNFYVLSNV